MEATDQWRITIEKFLGEAIVNWADELDVVEADDSSWWSKCVAIISFPFLLLAMFVVLLITPILVGVRLAVLHADRVVFVFASAILSFYQVPRKVFYIYIAVLAGTGFLQFLRTWFRFLELEFYTLGARSAWQLKISLEDKFLDFYCSTRPCSGSVHPRHHH